MEPIESPCRQICRLGGDGLCDGCGRTLGEIALWSSLSPAKREIVMRRVRDWTPRPADPIADR
jgi:predicted Fe-S protein YdhL (DUF1289 family)